MGFLSTLHVCREMVMPLRDATSRLDIGAALRSLLRDEAGNLGAEFDSLCSTYAIRPPEPSAKRDPPIT
jgi:hypothetical protein